VHTDSDSLTVRVSGQSTRLWDKRRSPPTGGRMPMVGLVCAALGMRVQWRLSAEAGEPGHAPIDSEPERSSDLH
jgi:hypothetical protein